MTLRNRILRCLRMAGAYVSTPDLILRTATGYAHPRQQVHALLAQLKQRGEVIQKFKRRGRSFWGLAVDAKGGRS